MNAMLPKAIVSKAIFPKALLVNATRAILPLLLAAVATGLAHGAPLAKKEAQAVNAPPALNAPADARTDVRTDAPRRAELYRHFWFDANERIRFCAPIDSLGGEYEAYGVERDAGGRPTAVTRYFYGNADGRNGWATMRISYQENGADEFQERTWYDPSGMPVAIGPIHAEQLLYKAGHLAFRRTVDEKGTLTNDTGGVSQSLFRQLGETIQQEFFFGVGKQHYGADLPWRVFGALPKGAYFRLYVADSSGALLREEIRNFQKHPIPFPGGEYARVYTPGACGLPERVDYLNVRGERSPNADGIAYETFVHDDHGRVVEWRAFDMSGQPKGRASDGAARLERSFRPFDGALIAEHRYDAEGKAIQGK